MAVTKKDDGHPNPAILERWRGQGTCHRLYAKGKTDSEVQSPLQLVRLKSKESAEVFPRSLHLTNFTKRVRHIT